jgi:predicted DNA-binding protein YlxM (UPF0122 family)
MHIRIIGDVNMSLKETVKYLVIQKILGKKSALCIIKNYFNGLSPSEILDICNVSKNEIIAYVKKVIEKAGSTIKAEIIVKHVINYIDMVPTLRNDDENVGNMNGTCPLCKKYFYNLPYHIYIRHEDVLNKYVEFIVWMLREKINGRKAVKNI